MEVEAVTDLRAVPGAGGVIWSAAPSGCHVNLVSLAGADAIAEHRNDDVDVLFLGVEGSAALSVDGVEHALGEAQALVVPRGATRSLRPLTDTARYLTFHTSRSLAIRPSRSG